MKLQKNEKRKTFPLTFDLPHSLFEQKRQYVNYLSTGPKCGNSSTIGGGRCAQQTFLQQSLSRVWSILTSSSVQTSEYAICKACLIIFDEKFFFKPTLRTR